ncbi:hypothetical protein, variant [Aphanomyces astaci]|uniref:F-box domain-containing protein n=1 Tax=Aphanomyces astaci TaxID=112090 RepID=W4G333_APHAT|nr:hypothetical protein, variant [Aphanomyces astaci]ETV73358.1 hypothetical protein, variant [Aphanomyces astaci]|eukprot:XP_009837232.1 hypothetical protein, variant [Aphanomyces astaci]
MSTTSEMSSVVLEAYLHRYSQHATADVLTVVAVKSVLDDMIGDIETWVHETEHDKLAAELAKAQAALSQYAIAERIHWDEKQNMLQKVHVLQMEGRRLARKLQLEADLVAQEVQDKERLEKELATSKEQIASWATLSRELARSQREVRELHRRLGIQSLLKPVLATTTTQGEAPQGPDVQRGLAALSDPILLHIFSNMDAMDVLSMSLTSKAMKARIHKLFGLKKEPTMPRSTVHKTLPSTTKSATIKPVPAFDKSQLARANDMIKSFNAKEMKLFHDLMLRMKSLEANLTAVHAEKEDLAARLHNAENVRDFLVQKLTDAEDALAYSIEEKVCDYYYNHNIYFEGRV